MIQIEHPIVVGLGIVVLVVGVVVLPLIKTERLRVTRSKIAALLLVAGFSVYQGSPLPAFIALWPLSLIWFPEYWGNFRGFIRAPYIDEPSPPIVVSAFGWFFLIVFPIVVVWAVNR